jgi:hypothetical protein
MDKECIINPKTGRAVVVKGKIGRQVLKKQAKTTAKPVNTMYSKPIGPVRPTEPTTAKPSATRPRPGRPKKPTEPTGARPSATRPRPKKVNTMYAFPIGPFKPTEPTTAKPSATRPRPKKVNTDKQIEPKIMVNTMYSKPIGPVKPKTEQPVAPKTGKVNLKPIKERINKIYEMVNIREFEKILSDIKDKKKMKEYSDDYIGNLANEIKSISIAVKGLPESVKKKFKPTIDPDLYSLNKYGTLDEDFDPLRLLKKTFEEEYNK